MQKIDKKEVVTIGGLRLEAHYGRAHRYKGSLQIIKQVGPNARILDIGSGERRLDLPNILNVDASKNKYLDIVVDAHYLPFRANIFDLIICEHLLEHVRKPWVAIEEIYKITKPGGFLYVEVPFMAPYHGRPHHYFNMTKEGVEQLCEKFQKVQSGVQPYNMPSYVIAMILSKYIRGILPFINKQTKHIEVYDTGSYAPQTSFIGILSLTVYNMLANMLAIFDRFIDPIIAEEIAAAIYYVGKK